MMDLPGRELLERSKSRKTLPECPEADFSDGPKTADVLIREEPDDEEDEPKDDDDDNNEEDDEDSE
jgi:hypothetical protein